MKKIYTTLILTCPLIPLLAQSSKAISDKQPQSPNLVLIMADQWRAQAVGFENIEPVKTPYMDQLVQKGVWFQNAMTNYPLSSPSRAMLMTGQYPLENKVIHICQSQFAPYNVELPQGSRCWSDILHDAGYSLGYIGKWHLDMPHKPYVDTPNNKGEIAWNEWCPKERRHGFDYWTAYGTYDRHLNPMYWNTDDKRDGFFYAHQWGPEFEADQVISYLKNEGSAFRKKNAPFALVVSMNPPHTGYNLVPDKYKEQYKELDIEKACDRPNIPFKGTKGGDFYRRHIRDYYACVTGVDEQIGRIVDVLDELGLSGNTIIVITSDHGNCMGIHGYEEKIIYYEESVRIPLLIIWPDKIVPRKDNQLQISIADLCPTLLSMMGQSKKIPHEVQAFDLSKAVITGKGLHPEFQPYYYIEPSDILTGRRGLRTLQYTFAVCAENGDIKEVVLFDRINDPWQMNNIADEYPKVVKKLTRQLKKWLIKTNDPYAKCL